MAVQKLSALGVFADKALLLIDGEKRMLQVGERSPEDVVVIEVDGDRVVVVVEGKREVLRLGLETVFPGSQDADPVPSYTGPQSITLWADEKGFFHASGSINGVPVTFLVDTGASSVAMSGELASRIGIRFEEGDTGIAQTAGGVTYMKRVFLEAVTVGDITLRNIEAGVLAGEYPKTPLLGMSFLGQLDMVREGKRMDLRRR